MPLPFKRGGLPGFGQVHFPEFMRQHGRDLVMDGTARILRYGTGEDSEGAPEPTYTPDEDTVLCHLEPNTRVARGDQVEADKVDETVTHMISFELNLGLDVKDQAEVNNKRWVVVSKLDHTDRLVDQYGVKEL